MGGVPKSSQLLGIGAAQATEKAVTGFSSMQISGSHVGFNKPASDAPGTLKEAIEKGKRAASASAFMIHTGDITHLSKPGQFDDAERVIGAVGTKGEFHSKAPDTDDSCVHVREGRNLRLFLPHASTNAGQDHRHAVRRDGLRELTMTILKLALLGSLRIALLGSLKARSLCIPFSSLTRLLLVP